MKAYELIKETFSRRGYIWIVHIVWLALYGMFWWLFLPTGPEFGRFIFIWGGFFLPLALTAGIFGDDIASGRICVLVTKPLWPGELYLCRLLGLSLQAAVQCILAGLLVFILHFITKKGNTDYLSLWLFVTWLLFNTVAALSTLLSVVVGRTYNSLLILVVVVTVYFVMSLLMGSAGQEGSKGVFAGFIRYPWPPFELLYKFANGEYGKYSLTVGRFSVTKSVACVVHSLILTVVYSIIGIVLLSKRQFSQQRD
jgi:ABC-type transport system involved in multi-copper enzyme maturation permease subunit